MARLDQYQGNCNQLKFLNFLDKKKRLSFFFSLMGSIFLSSVSVFCAIL